MPRSLARWRPLLWAALALLVTAAQPIPPFELVFLTFGVAFLLAFGKWSVERALAAACALIVGGAALAAGGLFAKARN